MLVCCCCAVRRRNQNLHATRARQACACVGGLRMRGTRTRESIGASRTMPAPGHHNFLFKICLRRFPDARMRVLNAYAWGAKTASDAHV